MNIQLRPYQKQAGNKFWAGMHEHQRQVIVLPTGTGKTVLGLAIAKRLFGKGRLLWVAHRQELITQPHRTCGHVWPEARRGIVKAQQDEYDAQAVFASIQTIQNPRRMARMGKFDLVILDECHHARAASWQRVAELTGCFEDGGPRMLGLTATPERTDGKSLGDIFQHIAYVYHITQAVKDGYLVPVLHEQRKLSLDLGGIKTKRGDFDEVDLDLQLARAGIVDEICKAVVEHRDRKTVVFTVSVQQAEDIAEKLKSMGVAASSVSGKTPPEVRDARLRRLKSGDIMCMSCAMLLTEGWDEPTIDCVIMGRPTKSKPLYIQSVGRGLRLHAPSNKRDCLVIDFVGATKYHSLIQAPVIFGADEEEANRDVRRQYEFDPDIAEFNERKLLLGQLNGLAPVARSSMRWVNCYGGTIAISAGKGGTVIARRDGDLWTVIAVKGNDSTVLVEDADLELAQGIAEDFVRRCEAHGWVEKDARWRAEPATKKQIDLMNRLKIQTKGEVTKGDASDFITQSVATDWRHQPATKKQLYALDARGIEYPKTVTKQQARRLLHGKL